jgi:hypothetical protein
MRRSRGLGDVYKRQVYTTFSLQRMGLVGRVFPTLSVVLRVNS